MSILKYTKRKSIPLISITGNKTSSLSTHSDVNLNVNIDKEACPLGLAPTTSSTATLALGDALAMVTLEAKGISAKNFAEWHPSGSLGARLLTKVKDIMHSGDALPLVNENTTIGEVLSVMTKREVKGATGVIDPTGRLVGVITDGDIRRFFEEKPVFEKITARDIMSKSPLCIEEEELAESALKMMEINKVQMLFVTKGQSDGPLKPSGVLGIQDLLRAKIK
jgi:arabinose-5-phosphate isomerase